MQMKSVCVCVYIYIYGYMEARVDSGLIHANLVG